MTAFSEELETEFQQMVFVLENVDNACWVYAVYSQAAAREEIIKRLKSEIELPFFLWDYSEEKPYPIDYLRNLTEEQKQQRAIVSFFNTTDGGDKTIKSLDFNREKFAQYPHSLIFWVTENELGEMARKAGHFWAQRRGTFDFSKLVLEELADQNTSYGIGAWLNGLLNIDNYQEALQQLSFYQSLLTEYSYEEQLPVSTQLLIAETTDKISYILLFLGRYLEAIDFCQQALSLYLTLLGENEYPAITASNNLALLYIRTNRYTEAEKLLQKSLSILEKHTDNTPTMATVLNNLGRLYIGQGRYNEAESLYQKSLEIREKNLGKYHPDVARNLNGLAALYASQNKYAKAEPLYLRSLAILEKALGKDCLHIATILSNLAKLYSVQGKYAQIEPLYKRSLEIRKKVQGINHPSTKLVKVDYEQFLAEQAAREKSNQP